MSLHLKNGLHDSTRLFAPPSVCYPSASEGAALQEAARLELCSPITSAFFMLGALPACFMIQLVGLGANV